MIESLESRTMMSSSLMPPHVTSAPTTKSAIHMTWTFPNDPLADGFILKLRDGNPHDDKIFYAAAGQTSITLTGLLPKHHYEVDISSMDLSFLGFPPDVISAPKRIFVTTK